MGVKVARVSYECLMGFSKVSHRCVKVVPREFLSQDKKKSQGPVSGFVGSIPLSMLYSRI